MMPIMISYLYQNNLIYNCVLAVFKWDWKIRPFEILRMLYPPKGKCESTPMGAKCRTPHYQNSLALSRQNTSIVHTYSSVDCPWQFFDIRTKRWHLLMTYSRNFTRNIFLIRGNAQKKNINRSFKNTRD